MFDGIKKLEKQTNYQLAFEQALDALRARKPEDFIALGARKVGEGRYELPVLEGAFVIDLKKGTVEPSDRETAASPKGLRIEWRILSAHYLAAPPSVPGTIMGLSATCSMISFNSSVSMTSFSIRVSASAIRAGRRPCKM